MNLWQCLQQVKSLLQAATWPDGSAEKVFGSHGVKISAGPQENGLNSIPFPFAMISPGNGTTDPDHQRIGQEEIDVTIMAANAADPWGEQALIGGGRGGGQGSSSGRGLLELGEIVRSELRLLLPQNGVKPQFVGKSAPTPFRVEHHGYVVGRTHRFRAWLTDARHYPAPTRFAATDAGGGDANLSWNVPPSRFDRYEVVLRRASGSTAPSSVTDGTGVSLGSLLATSVTDSPGTGTWSYALFGGYDELSAGASDRYSSPATVTVTLA